MPPVKFDTVSLEGGFDQITPILSLPAGACRDASNFECSSNGGYTRIAGYERFDGQAKPSDSLVKIVYIDSFTNVPVIGDTITGSSSGATAVVAGVGSDYMAYTKVVGIFDVGVDNIMLGALLVGASVVGATAITALNQAIYKAAAADQYRADITEVPGIGTVIGAFLYNDVVYALRTESGLSTVNMYKSSSAGWVQVPFYHEIYFDTGSVAVPTDGDTLTQGGVTATIKRVVRQSGSTTWAGDTAGELIITAPSGGNFAAGAATIGSTTLNLTGAEVAITLTTGGKLEFDYGNFFGSSDTNRVYCVDGVNKPFEFDGDVLVLLDSGSVPDNPTHVKVHKNHLFMSFGSSLISSAPGDPYDYTALSGAGELATGQEITGLTVMSGSQTAATLMVTSRSIDGVHLLYGSSWSDFNYVSYNSGGGAIAYTVQNMDQTYMMDDRGVTSLSASQSFGNFDTATLTQNINRYIYSKRALVSCSTLERRKGQYRLFFSDQTALFMTIVNGKLLGSMPIRLDHAAYTAFEGKYSDGTSASFICTDDGYVMELERGTSFDGAAIDAYIVPNYNPSGNHRMRKRYRACSVAVDSSSYLRLSFGYTLSYGSTEVSQPNSALYDLDNASMVWDNFTWDNFTWDGLSIEPLECEMLGTGENVALAFRTSTNYYPEYTINTATIHYSLRRNKRG